MNKDKLYELGLAYESSLVMFKYLEKVCNELTNFIYTTSDLTKLTSVESTDNIVHVLFIKE